MDGRTVNAYALLTATVNCAPAYGALYPAPLARPFFKGLLRWRDGGILIS